MNRLWNKDYPEVPVDKDGNWLHFADWTHVGFQPVTPFQASLKVDAMRSGRSAKYLILRSDRLGITFPMFIADLLDFMRDGDVVKGEMFSTWTASKRGANYGIKVKR